jgi:GDP-L-fucose synthase
MSAVARIFVAGHRGLVGSAIVRKLKAEGAGEIVTRTRQELDLLSQGAVDHFFQNEKIDQVYMAAAKVGGIVSNSSFPADFLYENLVLATNVLHAAARGGVGKLLFLGSSCIYPRLAPQPIREDSLLTGPLEKTNEWYAIAKIAGLKLCEAVQKQYGRCFISAMPTNLYGPGDNFHPEHSHVIPGMMRRFHEAKASHAPRVTIWGTGTPRREFLHVEDLADALVLLMREYTSPDTINVGTGADLTIRELAELMKDVVGYSGELSFDTGKPDGTPQKVLDVSRIQALGWKARRGLREGLASTYAWAKESKAFT